MYQKAERAGHHSQAPCKTKNRYSFCMNSIQHKAVFGKGFLKNGGGQPSQKNFF
jgi:hypothetical protein